jgi:cobalt-zinc-cadmium efflux system membrane fusion protein
VKNLGIKTVEVSPTTFEDTLFALGRIEVIPSKRGVVSSRIPGRISELLVHEGDHVTQGQHVARLESRQPGSPPPSIDLIAPMEGLVMQSHVSLGEPVEPDTDILEIIDLRSVYAVARVPEDHAGQLTPGIKARISIAALPGEALEGEMIRFGTSADAASGTLDALFLLEGLDGKVRPHMRAEFAILLDRRENVMAIPRDALQGDAANPFVFVKDFDLPNAFVKAPVKTGARNDRYVEIGGGLFPSDEVVTTGGYALAFAGAGSISLKEALDAAHGHEHNEDGSELTPAQEATEKAASSEGGGSGNSPLTLFLALLSGLLLVLLILSLFFRRQSTQADA